MYLRNYFTNCVKFISKFKEKYPEFAVEIHWNLNIFAME